MNVFTLYVGSAPRSSTSRPVSLERLKELLTPLFPSFTILDAIGVFRGMTERTFVIKVTPLDVISFYNDVDFIRQELDQDGIGVEYGPGYHRIAEGGTLSAWLEEMFPQFRPEYLHALFRSTDPETGLPHRFAVITASNPDGRMQSASDNAQSDAALAARLAGMGTPSWRVTGFFPEGLHSEAGFGIETSLLEALSIGREFRQEAVYWVRNGNLSLVSCTCRTEVPMGSWASRQSAFESTGL